MVDRHNILLIVSDEERRNDWLDGVVDLPAHERLHADPTTATPADPTARGPSCPASTTR